MTQTYSVAITDGGFGPVNIKINLSFKEALKEALSCLEHRDISRICNLYAISTENHNEALAQIQEIIERHLARDNEYYYHNDSQDNTFIDINMHPEGDPYNNIRIEIGGYAFFAFAKQEDQNK